MEYINLTTILIGILLAAYLYMKKVRYNYWKRRGLPYVEPEFFYGNMKRSIKGEVHMAEDFGKCYREFKRRGLKHGGMYFFFNPVYLPVDPELIKNILHKDFDHFVNHGNYHNEEADPLSGHLVNLENAKWKNLRAKLSPTFTSGKMKMMFQTLVACSDELEKLLNDQNIRDAVDIKQIMARFTTDVIGSCAFGLDCDSLRNPDSEFQEIRKRRLHSKMVEYNKTNFADATSSIAFESNRIPGN
ncbi:hypothetical protein NQ318_010659 [Aromia moschata]|uniref:Cytochrome P450 n=1 Tax=Aromia moschata TaxID=1265417 RepID=A0AAV8XRG2_9CUCU|nr:hypothetical protein NQ318_010659 [Aromia moschata]